VNPFAAATPTGVMHRVLQAEVPRPSRLDAKVSPSWDPVLERALARKPAERFQSAREFHRAAWEAMNGGA